MAAIEHTAGVEVLGVQRCRDCDTCLVDLCLESDRDLKPFKVGAAVVIEGRHMELLEHWRGGVPIYCWAQPKREG